LDGTSITDRGAEMLARMDNIRILSIRRTKVTQDSARNIEKVFHARQAYVEIE
jgi:hypothetical protein